MNSGDNKDDLITVAVCCYNAAHYLVNLIESIAALECPIPFEILIIDNNSHDNTKKIVKNLTSNCHIPIRYVTEKEQGIPFARNRAIKESRNSKYLAFIDSDELPDNDWLSCAVKGLVDYSADCVGGQIVVDIPSRPKWMSDSILLFLGKVDYGTKPFRIKDRSTPVWSGNIAYRTSIFSGGINFDTRYNREGSGIGGGSDGIMFREMLKCDLHIRYEPDMRIRHLIPESKIRRSYFIKLHYIAGKKSGMYEINPQSPKFFGIPRFMYLQLLRKLGYSLYLYIIQHDEYLRESMNASYHFGTITGLYIRHKKDTVKHHA